MKLYLLEERVFTYSLEFFCKEDLSLLLYSFNLLLISVGTRMYCILWITSVGYWEPLQIGPCVALIGPHIFFKLPYFLALQEAPG